MILLEFLRKFFGLSKNRFDGKTPVGWSSLAALLEDLETVGHEHEEIFDTDVRERLWTFLEARFIQHDKKTSIPAEFGMFTPEGNESIRAVFARNTEHLDTIIDVFSLDTYEKRKLTLTNPKLTSAAGNRLDDLFGAP